MFAKFATIFKIPELRRKIWLTLFLLFVYRMGFYIPLPPIALSGEMPGDLSAIRDSGSRH